MLGTPMLWPIRVSWLGLDPCLQADRREHDLARGSHGRSVVLRRRCSWLGLDSDRFARFSARNSPHIHPHAHAHARRAMCSPWRPRLSGADLRLPIRWCARLRVFRLVPESPGPGGHAPAQVRADPAHLVRQLRHHFFAPFLAELPTRPHTRLVRDPMGSPWCAHSDWMPNWWLLQSDAIRCNRCTRFGSFAFLSLVFPSGTCLAKQPLIYDPRSHLTLGGALRAGLYPLLYWFSNRCIGFPIGLGGFTSGSRRAGSC